MAPGAEPANQPDATERNSKTPCLRLSHSVCRTAKLARLIATATLAHGGLRLEGGSSLSYKQARSDKPSRAGTWGYGE